MDKQLTRNKRVLVPLLLTFGFFLYKGLQYALIGSFVPMLIPVIFGAMFMLAKSMTTSKRVLRMWAWLLILWSVIRLVLSIGMIIQPFDEYHISTQLGPWSLILTTGMFILSILLLKSIKKMT